MINKRPCVILVADSNMAATFRGYFKRDGWHLSLGCTPFEMNTDVGADLLVDEGGNDPGVYTKGHELLRPYQSSHHRALVVLDCEWEGAPDKAAIVEHITARLVASGWAEDAVKVIAIEPELENWLWQDKPQVADALRYKGDKPLRQYLADSVEKVALAAASRSDVPAVEVAASHFKLPSGVSLSVLAQV
ncbi:hypothetical protein VUS21_31765 [Pseudomonas aeruginosa]|uniref:methylation-associated defense system protein MAD4 n=1 Tax=Pseudomonas aeruginosa TaxID=287 RepID=UPI0030079FCF